MFVKCYQKFDIIATDVNGNRYVALVIIMRIVHPMIMEYTVEFHIPKQGNVTDFTVHVNNFMDLSDREYL